MNSICSFRLCKLSDEELLNRVDKKTDSIFINQEVPTRHVPARPEDDYDLLVGELVLRYKEKCKLNKFLAIQGGGDWADASVNYMINSSGKSGDELLTEYYGTGGYSGNCNKFFRDWVIAKEYCREATENEVDIVEQD